jgi:hypothetical protein
MAWDSGFVVSCAVTEAPGNKPGNGLFSEDPHSQPVTAGLVWAQLWSMGLNSELGGQCATHFSGPHIIGHFYLLPTGGKWLWQLLFPEIFSILWILCSGFSRILLL